MTNHIDSDSGSPVAAAFKNPDSLVLVNGYTIHFQEKCRNLIQTPYGSYHPGDAKLEGLLLSVYCGSINLRSGKFTGEVNMASFEIETSNVKEIRRSDDSLAWRNEEIVQDTFS